MIKKKTISLSRKDIDSLISGLSTMQKDLSKLSENACEELAKVGLDKLNTLYSQRIRDDNIDDISTKVVKTEKGYNLISQGKDVIYEEFGTGDMGEQSPHAEKGKYPDLNDYNSGKYIRDVSAGNATLKEHGITSGKYWTYKKDSASDVKYTQGVVAGMEMYKTSNYIQDTTKEILKKKASDVLSKL